MRRPESLPAILCRRQWRHGRKKGPQAGFSN
jgi:hypothetical protein